MTYRNVGTKQCLTVKHSEEGERARLSRTPAYVLMQRVVQQAAATRAWRTAFHTQ
ncbi:hypothetical protein K377_07887 [Streptomyces sp. PsTaAH-137]|nr:hypothetical protein K377_07887 [Streptomyces sp. PsTaAH-137]